MREEAEAREHRCGARYKNFVARGREIVFPKTPPWTSALVTAPRCRCPPPIPDPHDESPLHAIHNFILILFGALSALVAGSEKLYFAQASPTATWSVDGLHSTVGKICLAKGDAELTVAMEAARGTHLKRRREAGCQ